MCLNMGMNFVKFPWAKVFSATSCGLSSWWSVDTDKSIWCRETTLGRLLDKIQLFRRIAIFTANTEEVGTPSYAEYPGRSFSRFWEKIVNIFILNSFVSLGQCCWNVLSRHAGQSNNFVSRIQESEIPITIKLKLESIQRMWNVNGFMKLRRVLYIWYLLHGPEFSTVTAVVAFTSRVTLIL